MELLSHKMSNPEGHEMKSFQPENTENCDQGIPPLEEDKTPIVKNGDVILAVPKTKILVLRLDSHKSMGQNEGLKVESEGQESVDEVKSDFEFINEVDFEGERESFVREVKKDHSYNSTRWEEKEERYDEDCICKLCGFISTSKGNLKHHMKR